MALGTSKGDTKAFGTGQDGSTTRLDWARQHGQGQYAPSLESIMMLTVTGHVQSMEQPRENRLSIWLTGDVEFSRKGST